MRPHPKLLLPLAILGLGFLGVLLMVATRPRVEPRTPEQSTPLVRVATATPREVQFTVRAQGTVVPRTESELVPQVSGEVVWVSPQLAAGGFFEAGEVLVRIDPADYEADLESARASVARATSEERRARTERERQRSLKRQGVTSQARIDDAENAYRVAEAALREARARLTRAERDLARTELKAAYAGRVRSENVDLGQFASRGAPLARLYAVDYAEVRLPVPDRELRYLDVPLTYRNGSVATPGASTQDAEAAPVQGAETGPEVGPEIGPEVLLHAEFAGERHVWKGRIVRTEGEIDAKSRMVTVVARAEDPYGRSASGERPPLKVGLFVDAEILGKRVPDAFVLPRAALRDGERVLVLDEDNRLHFRDVTVLRAQQEEIVIGAGLSAGERVCVSALPGAVEGMTVRVADTPPNVARAGS